MPATGGTATSRTIPERPIRPDGSLGLVTLDGRYHVVDRIAAGGMGEVFRAHDAVLAREVAIKVLHPTLAGDPGFVDRFRREARAAAGLSHPNIVAVHDWGAVDGIYFMVMEFVRGQSLREVLNEHGLLAPAQTADVLLQVLAALEHAHGTGIVHRDVKPENVMLTKEGAAKVADFGLARAYADAYVTQEGRVSGTVQYLAPEQLQGEPADPRTDLYSLGIVAYELLTGRVPFTAETQMAIAYRHVRERVPRPSARNPAVPSGLDGWVLSMTEKEREMRPESAAEARRDLESETHALPASAPVGSLVREAPAPNGGDDPARAATVTIPRAERAKRRRRRGSWILGTLFLLAALGAAAWGAWTYLVPREVDVPGVVGLTVEDASALLEDAGLVVKLAEGRHSMRYEEGEVIRVQPPAGTTLETGDTVTLVPSLGPPPVPVPDLFRMTVQEAEEALEQAGLVLGEPVEIFSTKVEAGGIVRQSEEADSEVPRGSAIDVWVSKGPPPKPVPKVVGLIEEQASSLLTTAGFLVDVDEKYSDAVERGYVISQSPPAKTKLQPGGIVTIMVSLGPRIFELPSFSGMSESAAVAAIKELNLVPAVLPVPGATGNTVVSQLPEAGTTVKAGQTITIYVA